MTNDNKQQKLSDSTDTAIAYSTCCVSGAVSKDGISLMHGDSLQALKGYSDNHFDVAIVDPPYGIGASTKKFHNGKNGKGDSKWRNRNYEEYSIKEWDKDIPNQKYFNELFRVSKNQIIWGGNYFTDFLIPKSGWIFWDKDNGKSSFSDGELAWTSFDKGLRKFTYLWNGFQKKKPEERFHPTQKPIDLYKFCLENYTNEGDLILDTHLGSGSIAIACHQMKRKLIAYEIDAEYYEKACKRFEEETRQLALW